MKIRFSGRTKRRLKKELVTAQKLNNLHMYKRVKALLFIGQQYHMDDIADLLNVSARTIYN